MGDTIWLEVTDGTQTTGGDRDNSIMLRLDEDLDRLAKSLGVPPLSGFYDHGALEDEYADVGGDEGTGGEPAWFDASLGRRTVEALQAALRDRPDALGAGLDGSRRHWGTMLADELEYCRATLAEAEAQGRRFHLLIVS